MDILYIIRKGSSKCNDLELRCSLRSIDQFGKNVGKVYVAGYCPEWLSDEVVKIPHTQPYENPKDMAEKHVNMLTTLLYAVDNSDIGEDFLVSMDDHMYTKETDFDNYPYYARCYKDDPYLPKGEQKTEYKKLLLATREFLKKKKLPVYCFSLHRNMHMSRRIIERCRKVLDKVIKDVTPLEPFAYLLNYQYKNEGFEITPVKDIKINSGAEWYKVDSRNTNVFSTGDFPRKSGLYILLRGMYNKKSKYEK